MTKSDVAEFLSYTKKFTDFSRWTNRESQGLINLFANGLQKYTLAEVMDAYTDVYKPLYATPHSMEDLLSKLVEGCEFNRLSEDEKEHRKRDAINHYLSLISRSNEEPETEGGLPF